ncbi:MAG: hypothetical protein AAGF97_09225 [Planctomycetota bacterium]
MAKKISASVGKGGKNKPVDTSGQVQLSDSLDTDTGNPPPSHALRFAAPASSTQEQVVVAFPIGDEFFYDPIESGPATSIDFQLDLLAEPLVGTSHVDVTLVVLQDGFFVAAPHPSTPTINGTEGWTQLSHEGLEADDFLAIDGRDAIPDFSTPFQFGYAFHANYSATALQVDLRLDNMEATIHTVPEPSGGPMLALAIGATVLWHRFWNGGD